MRKNNKEHKKLIIFKIKNLECMGCRSLLSLLFHIATEKNLFSVFKKKNFPIYFDDKVLKNDSNYIIYKFLSFSLSFLDGSGI